MAEDGILNSKLGENNDTPIGSGLTGAVTGVTIKQNTGNETFVKTNEEMDCSEHESGGNPSQSVVPTVVASTVHDRLVVGAVTTEDKEMEVDDDSSNGQNQDELQGHNAEPVDGGGATPKAMESPQDIEKEIRLAKDQLSAIETRNRELLSAMETLQKRLDDTKKENEDIKRQLDIFQEEKKKCQEENKNIQTVSEFISTENEQFQKTIESLEKDNVRKAQAIDDYAKKDIDSQQKLCDLSIELNDLKTRSQQEIRNKDSEIKKKVTELEEKNKLLEKIEKDIKKKSDELSKYKKESEEYRNKVQAKIKGLQEESEKSKQKHKQTVDQLMKDKNALNKRTQELNEYIKRSENEHKNKLIELSNLLKEERENFRSLQFEYNQVHQRANEYYAQALTLQEEKKGLEGEKQGLLLRLSKLAGANLTFNNPNIADLSDERRPTKLAEEFSELYDNEWTDAFEEIDIEDEGKKTNFMLGILVRANQLCQDLSNEHVRRIKDSFAILTFPTPAKQTKQDEPDEHGDSDNDKNTPSGELNQTDPGVSLESSKENEDLVKSYIVVSNEDTLENGAPKTEQQEKKPLVNEQENKATETDKLEPELTAIHKENKEAEREKGDQTNEESPADDNADTSFASGNGDDGKTFVNRFESGEEGETNGDSKQEKEENKKQSVKTDDAALNEGNGKQEIEENQEEKTAKTGDVATHIKEEANGDDKQKREIKELDRTGRTDRASRDQGDSNDDNRHEGNDENKANKTVKIVDIKPEGVPNDKDEDKRDGNNTAAANETDQGDEDEEKEGTDDKAPGNMNQNDTEENATAKVNNSIAHGTEDGDGKDDKGAKEKQKIEEPEYKWMQLESDFDLLQNEAKKTIFEAMKFFEVKLSPEVKTAGTDKIVQETGINKESQETVVTYIQKCIDICWSMCRHQPPVHIDLPDIGDDVPFDTNKYKPYTKSGKHVSYIVWPALYLHDGGPLLSKGVAQGK